MLHLFLTFALYDRVSAKEIVSDLRFEVMEDTLIMGWGAACSSETL
jgi:hypothetical protein